MRKACFLTHLCFCGLALVTLLAYAVTERDVEQLSATKIEHAPYHHHIHNFYFNDVQPSQPNYLAMQAHAHAMSYHATTHYLADQLPGELDKLHRILLHNAYYIPLSVDFSKHQVKYNVSYQTARSQSVFSPNRQVWNSYPISDADIALIKTYACAKSPDYVKFNQNSRYEEASRYFRMDPDYKTMIVNWQSRYVVERLHNYTLSTLNTGKYDILFFDDVPRNPGDCLNKTAGGKGFYQSWKDGQLAFLSTTTKAAHLRKGYHKESIKVFGNIWSPYADTFSAKWYANQSLRLDHYYFESGGHAREDFLHGQSANSTDPETGLPAYAPLTGGYIPARLMSLGTHIKTMQQLVKTNADEATYQVYLKQHYDAAGLAASQGAWFGWYGVTSVDQRDHQGRYLHNHEMQLLRALPNWENLANVPLVARYYSAATQVYKSPNSQFNAHVIQAVNPKNMELYALFKTTKGVVDTQGREIKEAVYVDDFFNPLTESAMPCLSVEQHQVRMTCSEKLHTGIRILFN